MGISDFTFSLIDSLGVSHSLTPLSWRIHDFYIEPSRMDMRVSYDDTGWGAGDFAGKMIVADGTTRPFLGYVEELDKPIIPAGEAFNLTCFSLHNLLRDRLLTHRFYTSSHGFQEVLSNNLGTIGILNDANHTIPPGVWTLDIYCPPNTYFCYLYLPGTISMYRDNVALKMVTDRYTMNVDEFVMDSDMQMLWVRTPALAPDQYQMQILSNSNIYRDTDIRCAPLNWWGYNDNTPIANTCCPNIQETAFDFLQRAIRTSLHEYRFFNQSDNTTYLAYRKNVGINTPKTYTTPHIIRLKEITLPDRGYQQLTHHTADSYSTCWKPFNEVGYDGYYWKEKRVAGFRLTAGELYYSCRANYLQRSASKAYMLQVLYDGTVGIGDVIRVQTGSYDFTSRVLEKIVDSKDKGKMTLILYYWWNI